MTDTRESIHTYTIKDIRFRDADKAARAALQSITHDLGAVVPANDNEGCNRAKLASEHLMQTWRSRLQTLRTLGWGRVEGKNWFYCMNCPPVGVTTDRRQAYPCHQSQVCPFCWCREYVYETYERLRFAYYGHDTSEPRIDPYTHEVIKPQPRPWDLLEVVTEATLDRELVEASQIFRENIETGRNSLVKRLKGWGAFQLFTVEPSDPRDPRPVWTFKQRLLVVTNPGSPDPPQPRLHSSGKGPKGLVSEPVRRFKWHKGITRSILIGAIGRVCQYPSQMMRGSQDDTVEILNFINSYKSPKRVSAETKPSGFRMAGFYGILRNKTQALREKKMGIH